MQNTNAHVYMCSSTHRSGLRGQDRSKSENTVNACFQNHTRRAFVLITVFTIPHIFPRLVSATTVLNAADTSPQPALNCSAVKHLMPSRDINVDTTDKSSVNGTHRQYCETHSWKSCCPSNLEVLLSLRARKILEKHVKDHISEMSHSLLSKSTKFNDRFHHLLLESKEEFHKMFIRTYGIIYEQNAYVFRNFYKELESYYETGHVDLTKATYDFFNILYQKMFSVLNAQYILDEKYLSCVSAYMKDLKPFGDVPEKFANDIKRAFVATRTYSYALTAVAHASKALSNIRLSAHCVSTLTRMKECGACRGYPHKPCANYCTKVIGGCLHYLDALSLEWENFTIAMDKLADRMMGPFNIVMIVEPINIKISEAIMNFQDSGQAITHRVFQGCGRPPLGRTDRFERSSEFSKVIRRDNTESLNVTNTFADNHQSTNFLPFAPNTFGVLPNEFLVRQRRSNVITGSRQKFRKKVRNDTKEDRRENANDYAIHEPLLDKMIRDIRQSVKNYKKIWSNLSLHICNQEEFSSDTEADRMCWNGQTIIAYDDTAVFNGSSNSTSNPFFGTARQLSEFRAASMSIRNAATFLKAAYNGQDVYWNDGDIQSGEGSGKNVDDEDYDGSGAFPERRIPEMITPPHVSGPGIGRDPYEGGEPTIRFTTDSVEIFSTTNAAISKGNTPAIMDDRSRAKSGTEIEDGNNVELANSGSASKSELSVRRALVIYLLPMYLAWFGSLCTDRNQ